MRMWILITLLGLSLSACASGGGYGPYEHTYGIPTLASTAAGAAIGANIGPSNQRGQNAVIGGIIGALAGTAAEHVIDNSYKNDPRYGNQQGYYQQPQQEYYQQGNYQQGYYAPQQGYNQGGQPVQCRPGYNCPQNYNNYNNYNNNPNPGYYRQTY